MGVRELKRELDAFGINHKLMIEKFELRRAVEETRKQARMRWTDLTSVRWSSTGIMNQEIFGAQLSFLDKTHEYYSLKKFFISLGVGMCICMHTSDAHACTHACTYMHAHTCMTVEHPSIEDYGRVLHHLTELRDIPHDKLRQAMLNVHKELNREVQYLKHGWYEAPQAALTRQALRSLGSTKIFLSSLDHFCSGTECLQPDVRTNVCLPSIVILLLCLFVAQVSRMGLIVLG